MIGGNPHFKVMEGFAKRIWGSMNVDKIVLIKKGIFVIRFLNKDTKEKAVGSTNLMLDKKPVFVKNWDDDSNLEKIEVVKVPTWIQLPNLPVRYWGQGCLAKIVEFVCNPIKPDLATQNRDRLAFARYLVEVPINSNLPDKISFETEKGTVHEQNVHYEWRPMMSQK